VTRRSARLGLALAALGILAAGFAAGVRFSAGRQAAPLAARRALYRCPMHPSYTADRPGACPICQMTLVPAGVDGSPGRRVLYYRSPMDPKVTSRIPAKDSMGMDFVPVYEDEAAEQPVEGRATVVLTPERRQLLGVRSEAVRRMPLQRTIRTVGRVVVDERLVHHVHTKFDGYVEHLYVDFTGKFVEAGSPLLSIYSPDLVATQQEYLLAHRAQSELAQGAEALAQGGENLLAAARQRLLHWGISAQDIALLEQTGEVKRTLDLHAERSGYVVQKTAVHGMRVTPSEELFDIADLEHLWVLADVYEHDLTAIRLGMPAEVSVPYLPGKRWQGPVTNVAPTVDERTRTIKLRVEVDNRGALLKPDMFADVFLRVALGPGLAVNESAVIDAGDRRLVFLDRGEGRYEPREVTLGPKAGSFFQVLAGLAEGDLVVTSANFLLDSESSLRAVSRAMSPAAAPTPR
jgi:Cu(I)/Ag(I) efflux system membrane fusion protein